MKEQSITEGLVKKTVDALDSYMTVLNQRCEENPSDELTKEILQLADLTNRWLRVLECEEDEMYDI